MRMRKNSLPGKVILASSSPRRKEILSIFFKVEVVRLSVDEVTCRNPLDMVIENSKIKALSVGRRNGVVVSGDTVVVYKGKILGKPKNKLDAEEMLSLLSGKWHEIYSGFFFTAFGKSGEGFSKTQVKFKDLRKSEIIEYIETGEPMDKAGAYAIQGKGSVFIEKIEGCYFTVVGFPVVKFIKRLKEVLIENS